MMPARQEHIHNTAEHVNPAEAAAYRKVFWRLIPFLFVCYMVSYLDRVNIGFAKLQMLNDLRFSEQVYGLGAGVFFFGYLFFEVPSNIILRRVGARVWIARIMISWGLVSCAMMFVASAPVFYALRFLLGACEAGFYPGVIFYLVTWFPADRRGSILATFIAAIPVGGALGGLVSGWAMQSLAGIGGLAGWQWLFIVEGLPSVLLGLLTMVYLDDRIETARWLSSAEKQILCRRILEEASRADSHNIRQAFTDPRVWLLSAVYFLTTMGFYGIGFWLPSLIAALGVKDVLHIGLLSAIPNAAAIIGMLLLARSSDRMGERRMHFAFGCLLGAAGLVGSVLCASSVPLAMVFLSLATAGIYACLPVFWPIPSAFLAGGASAAGFAVINSIGNFSGFVSPSIVGWIKTTTGSADYGVYALSLCVLAGGVLMISAGSLRTSRRLAPRLSEGAW
jgi:sugar phosphate permease